MSPWPRIARGSRFICATSGRRAASERRRRVGGAAGDVPQQYSNVAEGNPQWNAIPVRGGELFEWDEQSTYIQGAALLHESVGGCEADQIDQWGARARDGGDSVTTDNISPAGSIKKDGPAGRYLVEQWRDAARFQQLRRRARKTIA